MTKEICIEMKSVQTSEEESETTELFTCGTMTRGREKEKFLLTYEESEATGFEGSSVLLTVSPEIVSIERTGSATASLVIEKNKKHYCHYGTPYGDFMVGITADNVDVDLNDSGGSFYLKYTIDINSTYVSTNEMTVTVKEK